MSVYAYRCRECDRTHNTYSLPPADDAGECPCGGLYKRVWSVNFKTPYKEHFNGSVGQHVSSAVQHADILKRQSETETMKSGVEHKFVPVDPADSMAVFGIKPEDAERERENTAKASIAAGTLDLDTALGGTRHL